jgi:3-(3-hydroxy-phenyl)propionate hydroxylase
MNTNNLSADVILVGYGPTGLVLASLLGQRGHQVVVVERWPQLYGKPRLTHIDGETARLVSLVGDGEQALREAWTTPHYNWINGKGQLLIDVGAGNTRKMLWDDHLSVHQPHIEDSIHERVSAMPNVRLLRGYLATGLEQDGNHVRLTCTPWAKGQVTTDHIADPVVVEGHYLVGADGSNSFVRQSLGIERVDFGFNEHWLCVDTEPLKPLPPTFNENAVQVCDPKRGHMFMPIGKKRQRFEFALLPGESVDKMGGAEAAWRLLKQYHGLGPDDLALVRHLVYTFECRLAPQWRQGRVFLAGDAAHTNPPYLGQGACSGMRDGANLAWKLDLVLQGVAPDALLDSYQVERLPHAKQLMLDSRALGLVANTSNPVKAAVRDLLFRFKLTPKPRFPTLSGGFLAHDARGRRQHQAGTLPGQGHLQVGGRSVRFDDHVGFHWSVVTRSGTQPPQPVGTPKGLENLGVCWIDLARTADTDGVYTRLLDALGADVAVIRPDFVLWGYAPAKEAAALFEQLWARMQTGA